MNNIERFFDLAKIDEDEAITFYNSLSNEEKEEIQDGINIFMDDVSKAFLFIQDVIKENMKSLTKFVNHPKVQEYLKSIEDD